MTDSFQAHRDVMQFLNQARAMRSALVKRLHCAVCAVFCVYCPQETETGGRCDVQSETEFFEGGQLTPQSKKKIRSELVVTTDEKEQCDVRASITYSVQGSWHTRKIGFEIIRKGLDFLNVRKMKIKKITP